MFLSPIFPDSSIRLDPLSHYFIEYESSWQQIWERFKEHNPYADAVVNFRIFDNGTSIFCGDIAKKK